ncbi:hypothetical protein BH24ACT26_BH24ACT26_17120 [soil metagenome]
MTVLARADLGHAAVLLVWAGFFTWLWVSGEVTRYLGPRTFWVVPFGALALGAAAIGHTFAARRAAGARPGAREVAGLLVLVLPVMAVVVVPRPSLGALAASRKAPSQGTIALGSLAAPAPQRGEPVSFIDIHYANESEAYANEAGITEGTEVHLLGFVTHSETTPDGMLELTRFYVSCCAADALPYSVVVDPAGGGDPGDDEWLDVSGRMTNRGGTWVLVADEMERRSEPPDPYLS